MRLLIVAEIRHDREGMQAGNSARFKSLVVRAARDAEEALRLTRDTSADLAIVDMVTKNRLGFVHALRECAPHGHIVGHITPLRLKALYLVATITWRQNKRNGKCLFRTMGAELMRFCFKSHLPASVPAGPDLATRDRVS